MFSAGKIIPKKGPVALDQRPFLSSVLDRNTMDVVHSTNLHTLCVRGIHFFCSCPKVIALINKDQFLRH